MLALVYGTDGQEGKVVAALEAGEHARTHRHKLEPTGQILELVLVLVPSDHGDGDVLPQPRPSPGS